MSMITMIDGDVSFSSVVFLFFFFFFYFFPPLSSLNFSFIIFLIFGGIFVVVCFCFVSFFRFLLFFLCFWGVGWVGVVAVLLFCGCCYDDVVGFLV